MAKNIQAKSIKQLDKIVSKNVESSIKNIAKDIMDDISENYVSCVDAFYNNYTPKSYERTYDTYFGLWGGGYFGASFNDYDKYSKIKRNENGWELKITLIVSYENLHNYYSDKPSYVFDRTWNKGIHGDLNVAPPLNPSPHDSMREWFKGFKKGLPIYIRERFLK